MPNSKIHVLEEFESLKGYCRQRRQRQKKSSVMLSGKAYSQAIAKMAAPKMVCQMFSSINLKSFSSLKNSMKDPPNNFQGSKDNDIVDPTSVTIHDTAKRFVDDINSHQSIKYFADKISGRKIDMEETIRNSDLSEIDIERRFSIHAHVRMKDESSAFRLLSKYFGNGSTHRVAVDVKSPHVVSIAEGLSPSKMGGQRSGGMVIFINPNFCCQDACVVELSGIVPREEGLLDMVTLTYKTNFWSNGDTSGLEITSRKNLLGSVNTFGSIVPKMEERHISLPGWNGRMPLWVPFKKCSCSISRCSGQYRNSMAVKNSQIFCNSNLNGTMRRWHCCESDRSRSPETNHVKSSCLHEGVVAFLTAFPCASPEKALETMSKLSQYFKNKETASMSLRGKMPALNLACFHGNVSVIRKLLMCGADPNMLCMATSSTPLHDAVSSGNVDIVQILLDHGANQAIGDDRGMTPLHHCCQDNSVAIARILLAHRDAAKALRKKDYKGRTPIALCTKNHLRHVVERERIKHNLKKKPRDPLWTKTSSSGSFSRRKKSTANDFMNLAASAAKMNGKRSTKIHLY